MEIETKHILFKHPSNILVVGMTGSGKTQLIRRILKNHKKLFYNLDKKIKVLWAYGQFHTLIDVKLADNIEVMYLEGIPTIEYIEENKFNIIVLDDLLYEMSKNKDFENLFIKKSHHLNISLFFSVQNLFYHSKNMRTISLNSHYIILMKNPRDKTQIKNLARQIYPSQAKSLISAYDDATEHAYGYIRIDLTPETPENLRISTRLTPEETNNLFAPIIYILKHD